MSKVCYIVGAGEFYGDIAKREGDVVIAADGGYDALVRHGIECDLLVGDMDSIESAPKDIDILRVPVEKDETDTYLCYLEGVRRGFDNFVIVGGVGGREDHTFANYSLLIGAIKQGKRVKLVSEHFDVFAISDEKLELCECKNHALSVFAFDSDATGVTIEGCKYEAHGVTLTPSFPLGVSNLVTSDKAYVSVEHGVLLLMIER
jgi:thiamine pyrophosphokinase